jgi:glycosyltransferase involved in cell wall biosynthesis
MPRIAVLMPVRNAGDTVRAAVRSTLRAMPKDSELVVWDDASTDRTRAELAQIMDARLRIIDSAVKVGPGAALRELCAQTDSELVARMDADDVCLPWRFLLQQAEMARGRADILFASVLRFRTHPLRIAPSSPTRISSAAMPLHLAVMCMLTHPTMMATRVALEASGGYRDALAEDYDLWLRASAAGMRLERTGVPVLAYRRHPAQVSFADDYHVRVLAEPHLRESYRAFIEVRFGMRSEWMPGTPVTSPSERESVRAIGQEVDRRMRSLPWSQRRAVERTRSHLPSLG